MVKKILTKNTCCRICGNPKLYKFLELGSQPLANAFLESEKQFKHESFFPLDVYFCPTCGHIQLTDIVSPNLLFRDYAYFTGKSSKTMKRHFKQFADKLTEHYNLASEDLVIDIGSNDGTFLKNFTTRIVGVDPAENIAKEANADGVPTICDYFTAESAWKILNQHGQAKIITATNVFAHVNNLYDFMAGVNLLLQQDGVFVVEVPHFLELYKGKQFDTCLLPEQKIFTAKGLKPISEIEVGDTVLTHKGRFRKVRKTFVRQYSGRIYEIRLWGHSSILKITPDHPVFVNDENVVQVDKLNIKTPLFRPTITETRDKEFSEKLWYGSWKAKTLRLPINKHLMKIIGFYLAEGSCSERCRNATETDFAFGKCRKEYGYAKECFESIEQMGFKSRIYKTKFGWHVHVCGSLPRFLKKHFKTGAKNKQIPNWVLLLPTEKQKFLLDCYIKGDGYKKNENILRVTTVSGELAFGITLIGNRLGYSVSLNVSKNQKPKLIHKNSKLSYPLPLWDILIKTKQKNKKLKVWIKNKKQYGRIRKTSIRDYGGSVYNLEVEEDNSYVTEICSVHNCYHEHLSYFLTRPLSLLAVRFNMLDFRVEKIPVHGGSIRCYFKRAKQLHLPRIYQEEMNCGLYTFETYLTFAKAVNKIRKDLTRLLTKLKTKGKQIVGYGAPAKGNTLLNYCQIGTEILDYVIDTTPYKQGKFTPGMHIPVVSPDVFHQEYPNYALMLPWNYKEEILRKEQAFIKRGGKFIIPIPEPKIIP